MDINELRSLIAVAEHGSLSVASRALGTDRSTLRRRLDALEARFGQALLHRDRRCVEPTVVGYEVVEMARAVVAQTEQMLGVRPSEVEPRGRVSVLAPVGMPPEAYAACARLAADVMPLVKCVFRDATTPSKRSQTATISFG